MPPLDLPGRVADGQILSAWTINQLRDAAVQLDALSFRPMPAFDSHVTGYDLGSPVATTNPKGNYRVWWGTLRYRTGMTTLTIEGRITKVAAENLQVHLNGALASTITASGIFSQPITLSGYADGDFIAIEIIKNGSTNGLPSVTIFDVYGSPVGGLSAWPGVPTFGTSYSAAAINQLISAASWLYDRMNAVPMITPQRSLWQPSNYKANTTTQLWSGAVGRYDTNDVLRVQGIWTTVGNTNEQLEIVVNGSVAATAGPYGIGTRTFSIPVGLSQTFGTRAEVRVQLKINAGGGNELPEPDGHKHSRFSFTRILSIASSSGGYAYATPPPLLALNSSISQTSLTSHLNAIATMLSNTKAAIDARPERWNRIRAFRKRYAIDDNENTKLGKTFFPRAFRAGDALVVRGKNIKVVWGAINPVRDDDSDYRAVWSHWEAGQSEQVSQGDDRQTHVVFFDALKGLYPGVLYGVLGDIDWCAELLSY